MDCKFFSFLSTNAEVYSSCFSLPQSSFSNSDLLPLSRNFYVSMRATITCVNKTKAMYERPRVKVKVERGSTFTFKLPYFTYPRKFYTRRHVKINRRWKSTLKSIKLNQAISWLFLRPPPPPPPPPPPKPFACPSKRVTVCDVIPSSNVASNANEQEKRKTSK